MPFPDPHENEPTVELDRDKVKRWREAERNAADWKKIADQLKEELQSAVGSAYAGLVDGQKVVTYRPSQKWAEARIRADYPDLVQHFMRKRTQEVFDLSGFRAAHPEIADKYQVRSWRIVD